MSRRILNPEPIPSKKSHTITQPTRLKPGYTGKINIRETTRFVLEPAPISNAARRSAYDKIKKIEAMEREKGPHADYEEMLRDMKNIVKDDLEISMVGIFPGEAKTEVGRAILSDGTFFIVYGKILIKCPYLTKKTYFSDMRKKFISQVT